MKILILQLARFGDILQTWPSLKALKRIYPQAEIHILTRKKFASAVEGFHIVNKVWALNSEEVLLPLLNEENYKESIHILNQLIEQLNCESYNFTINLTFSSFSSHLLSKITSKEKRGYNRFADGTVDFADSTSAYFYAQVGVGRHNRIHVCDLFAKVAGVELTKDDWNFNYLIQKEKTKPYIVIHLGASDAKKQYPVQLWAEAIAKFLEISDNSIVLIGTEDEKTLGETICNQIQNERIENKIGQTKFNDLFQIYAEANGFVGCDSGPLQLASLLNLRSLNLSFSTVNFFETGPKAENSRILFKENPNELSPLTVAYEINHLINESYSFEPMIYIKNQTTPYKVNFETDEIGWNLLNLIYFNGDAPVLNPECIAVLQSIQKISSQLSKQLILLQANPLNQQTLALINILEHKILVSKKLDSALTPIIDWFETEKRMIPPCDFKNIVVKTQKIYQKLYALSDFLITATQKEEILDGNDKMDTN